METSACTQRNDPERGCVVSPLWTLAVRYATGSFMDIDGVFKINSELLSRYARDDMKSPGR